MKVIWKGVEYLFIGSHGEGGAICSEGQFSLFGPSEAHLYDNGNIMQRGKVVGTKKDLKFIKEKGDED